MRLDHVGIAVNQLDAAVEHYRSTFGLVLVTIETNGEQGVREAMLRLGADPGATAGADPGAKVDGPRATDLSASYVQLLEPLAPDTPVGRFLARRGEGLHHVGYAVENLVEEMKSLAEQGIQLLDERPRHGSMGTAVAFAHPRDFYGVLTELVQSPRA